MHQPIYKIFLCDILNPLTEKECNLIRSGAIVVKKSTTLDDNNSVYKIVEIGKESKILQSYSTKESIEIVDMIGQIAMPSFFDLHFHWVQDDVREMPKVNLLKWLENYTWPNESKFKDKVYSKNKAEQFAKKLLSVGTLGGACYASIHGHSVDHALEYFVGDYTIGNVLMDMNSPDYLTQTKAQAKKLIDEQTERFKSQYAVTPRFAITTTPEVMEHAVKKAKEHNSFVQTHLCETKNEIDFVLSIYKNIKGYENIKSYTEIYKKCKILGPKTIMGHCIHMTKDELEMISKSKTTIAHCPTSNGPIKELGLGSGLFNFKEAEKFKINWALASDIGGGPFLSMFDVMRSFVAQNKKAKVEEATFVKALYRATVSGAELLKLSNSNGNFEKGKKANLIFVNSPETLPKENAELVLEKIVNSKARKRDEYINLVNYTYFEGNEVYSSL